MEKASEHLYAHYISSNVEKKLTKHNWTWSELLSDSGFQHCHTTIKQSKPLFLPILNALSGHRILVILFYGRWHKRQPRELLLSQCIYVKANLTRNLSNGIFIQDHLCDSFLIHINFIHIHHFCQSSCFQVPGSLNKDKVKSKISSRH